MKTEQMLPPAPAEIEVLLDLERRFNRMYQNTRRARIRAEKELQKLKKKEQNRRYYLANRERCIQNALNWQAANPERVEKIRARFRAKSARLAKLARVA